MQELAEGRGAGFSYCFAEPVDADLDLALIVVASVRLAVRLEPAPLVEVEQHAADLVRGQSFGQCPRPQAVHAGRDVARLAGALRLPVLALAVVRFLDQLPARLFVLRHQAVFGQGPEQRRAPGEIAVPPPSHGPRRPAVDGQGRARFRLPPVAEDARADSQDGAVLLFQRLSIGVDQAPAERSRAEVNAQRSHKPPPLVPYVTARGNLSIWMQLRKYSQSHN
jgi:hypothetical protein